MKNRNLFVRIVVSFGVVAYLLAAEGAVGATSEQSQVESLSARPVTLILALAAFSLIPFVLMAATSFVKISIVLNILRNALGAQQVPPPSVVSAIAVILTLYVMHPTIEESRRAAEPILSKGGDSNLFSKENASRLVEAVDAAKEPLRDFLQRNSSPSSVKLFLGLATSRAARSQEGKGPASEKDFKVLLPAFLVTELGEAFFIGFLIFLPFLVIELVISNVLLSLGMHMLSPSSISLPFKLLLFVSVSGWEILSKGLVVGYS